MSSNTPQPDPVPGASHAPPTAVDRNIGLDPSAGYERRDANVRTILWLVASVAATCALVFWGAYSLRGYFENVAKENDPEVSPLVDPNAQPPAPRLQDTPIRDLADFRAAEERTLTSYAWVNRQEGIVQIPVDRAIDLLVERGLPAPTGQQSPQQPLENGEQPPESPNENSPENSTEPPLDRPPPENR